MIENIYILKLRIENDKAWGNKNRIIGYYTSKDKPLEEIIKQMISEQRMCDLRYKIEYKEDEDNKYNKDYIVYNAKYTDRETNELIETREYIIETVKANTQLVDMFTM